MGDVSVHIAEFEKLKDEQIELMGQRDRLRHQTMLLLGGGIALAVQYPSAGRPFMIALPMVSFVTGMTRTACDRRIEDIGYYFRSELAPKISKLTETPLEDVFGWQSFLRHDHNRSIRKALDLLTNLFLYVGSGVGAIVLYAMYTTQTRQSGTLSFLEMGGLCFDAFLMFILLWQMLRPSSVQLPAIAIGKRPWIGGRVIQMLIWGILAAGVFWAVSHYGPQLCPQYDISHDIQVYRTVWRVPLIQSCAAATALVIWSLGLLSIRH